MRSGRPIDSTLTTSAPSEARTWAAEGPAHHAVQSTTRTPASGGAQDTDPFPFGRGSQTTVPVWAPGAGAGSKARGSTSEMRYGTRGWRKRPDGADTNVLRAPNCSNP